MIAYHLRQSFKPGETDPATANKIGYDLAMSLTKGHHAFIDCTHTDKHHIHSHIIFNSTSLDCTHKFQNFWNSSFVVRRISDQLRLQNGLSVIEAPKSSRGSYGTWLGDNKKPRPSFLRFEGLGGMAILEKLREQSEQTKTEIRQLENRMKRLVQEQSQLVRKERTRRLIERGAILESIIPEAEKLTNEQIKSVLVAALRTSIAAQALERVRTEGTSNDSPAPV